MMSSRSHTHRDTTMLERAARAAWEANREYNNPDLEHGYKLLAWHEEPGVHENWLLCVRAILNELKQVDEGMVKAGRKKYFEPNHTNGLNGVIADIITSAIDHVLREGEG